MAARVCNCGSKTYDRFPVKHFGLILLVLVCCVGLATAMGKRNAPEKHAAAPVDSSQGIRGKVEIWEGDFMPMVDPKSTRNKILPGSGRKVRVFSPYKMSGGAKLDSVASNVIAESRCDSAGIFFVATEPGDYSVFVEDNGGWYANSWNGQGVQGAVTVEAKKITTLQIKITSKATF